MNVTHVPKYLSGSNLIESTKMKVLIRGFAWMFVCTLFCINAQSQTHLSNDSSLMNRSISFENLVFEGAGIKGIAYSGVLKALQEKGILQHVERVCGTSAGAITALMVSLGYSSEEIYQLISDTKFQKAHRTRKGSGLAILTRGRRGSQSRRHSIATPSASLHSD